MWKVDDVMAWVAIGLVGPLILAPGWPFVIAIGFLLAAWLVSSGVGAWKVRIADRLVALDAEAVASANLAREVKDINQRLVHVENRTRTPGR